MKQFKLLLIISLLGLTITVKSQMAGFTFVFSKADSLRRAGDLYGSIDEFRKTMIAEPKNASNVYNFACALALTNQVDSSFTYLNKAIEMDTSVDALMDPDFMAIKDDKRWKEIEDRIVSMMLVKYKKPYKELDYAKKLWNMKAKDQAYYTEIELASNKLGKQSTVVKALWTLKHIYNEENQKELIALIDEKGWPKSSEVGGKASSAAFLIIQHSDAQKQKKYLPIIEQLCKEKEASWQSYALMYDRVQTSDNLPQKYGSQVRYNNNIKKYELLPLLDETMVDQWRKEIGIQPLAEYLANWEIKFEPKKK